tara:strand:+ start:636 stop:1082 length:447 start_codon:yes stop_codon:yes gene_type:complete
MTQEQRDWGKVISIAVLAAIVLMAALFGCTPYIYKSNQVKVTHVLAVTETGDTVKIAMRDIQPTQVYNVVGYDFVRGYNNPYYDPWRRYHMYDNYYRYYGNPKGTNVQGITPNWKPPAIINNNGSKTTGGGNNPVAVNPARVNGKKVN